MVEYTEFKDDLYIVTQDMRPGWFCSVVIVLGEKKIGVIDTGFEDTPADLIIPAIEKQGRSPKEVNLIVNTHRDRDHIRGNQSMKDLTGAKIVAHSLEAEAIPVLDDTYNGGDKMEIGDRVFEVIHTPGHRPGAVCLYDRDSKLLVTGDSICGTREDLIRMDKEIYIESLKGLLDVDVTDMIMSHPFQPAGKNVLSGSEISEMIEASIQIAENLERD